MRNLIVEKWLEYQGVGFDYIENFPLENIDLGGGQRNQARLLEPIDEELVTQFAQLMKDGVQFPAVILARIQKGTTPPKGRWVPCDGNTRLAATVKIGRKATAAYLLKTVDEAVVNRITWSANLTNGRGLSYEERMEHAITFCQKYGMEAKVASKEWGLSYGTLAQQLRNRELRSILDESGISSKPLTDDKVKHLAILQSVGNDVFTQGALAAIEYGLNITDIDEMTRKVKRGKTTEEKAKAIQEYVQSEKAQARKAATKGGKIDPKVDIRAKYKRLVLALEAFILEQPRTARRPLAPDLKDLQESMLNIITDAYPTLSLGVVPDLSKQEAS